MKTCSDCGGPRPDNHPTYCRPCAAARSLVSYYKHHEKRLASNADRKEYKREWARRARADAAYRARERDNRLANYAADPEKFRDTTRRWRKNHPERNRELVRRRRARIIGREHEIIDPAAIHERDGGLCHLCRQPVALTDVSLDHLLPISRGGAHVASNVAVSHLACNVKRGTKPLVVDLKRSA